MTDDRFPPESNQLPGDPDNYPVVCPACERHVTTPYSHRRDCEHWGETTDPRPDADAAVGDDA